MAEWSLARILSNVHNDIQNRLAAVRESFAHSTTKGDASERVWLEFFQKYLPKRYQAERARVVDSNGVFSEQIDIVILDRQYSPFIFDFQEQKIVAAESVYAVFEAKQTAKAAYVTAAQDKVQSVRRLHRTSLPIPYAGGTYPPKSLPPILGGLLTFESEWTPPLGDSLKTALESGTGDRRLDIGCIAAHGMFSCDKQSCYTAMTETKAATAFLLELIARLQDSATVPMIDVRAYAKWLATDHQGAVTTPT
jgi:hypothetical protein